MAKRVSFLVAAMDMLKEALAFLIERTRNSFCLLHGCLSAELVQNLVHHHPSFSILALVIICPGTANGLNVLALLHKVYFVSIIALRRKDQVEEGQ